MTDLERRAKEGDQGAFERLVMDNQNRVYSLALRLCGDREAAADLAQEAFIKAWQGEQLCHLGVPAGYQPLHRLFAEEETPGGGRAVGVPG